MQTKSFMTALITVLALGAAGVSQTAFAQSDDVATVKVQYADLNLSSPAGAKVMLQRIHRAADAVCGPQSTSRIDRVARLHETCVKHAISGSVRQLNIPMVTALYTGGGEAALTTLASAR
jgi:UrcA family protein